MSYIKAKAAEIRTQFDAIVQALERAEETGKAERVNDATERVDALGALLAVLPRLDTKDLRALADYAGSALIVQSKLGR